MSRKVKVMLSMCVAMLSLVVGAASAAATQPEAVAEAGGIAGTTFIGTGGAGKLETTAGSTVSCTGNKSSGTISSATMINGIVVKFTGCSTVIGGFFKAPCKSAAGASGEIITNSLTGTLEYIVAGSSRAGIDLAPESGDFATFSCTLLGQSATLTVRGSVIGEITPVNGAFGTSFELDVKQAGGMQAITTTLAPSGCAATKDVPETEATGVGAFPFEESGVEGNEVLTTSKKIKIVGSKCS